MKISSIRKKTKRILIFISAATVIGLGTVIVRAVNPGLSGFSWIGNNLQEGVEQGDPVIGMIGLEGNNYQIILSGEGDQRQLVGSAWFGIGSLDDKFNDFTNQSDLPSIGWIHFNQSFDGAKLATLISGNCFGAGDCYGVRWNKKPGSPNANEGYLSGWARVELGPNGDGASYPDVWLHFKAPADVNNYACDENARNYYVCSDATGKLDGFAWAAGAESVSINGNPGLGWIKFSKLYASLDTTGVVAANTGFCATLLGDGSEDVACTNDANFNGQFNFKAYQSGITLNKFDPNKNYQWVCAPGEAPKEGEKVTCEYKKEGAYSPQLKVYNETTQKWADCTNQASVTVTDKPGCSLLVRKATSGGQEEFADKLSITPNDTIEAKVKPICVSDYQVDWSGSTGVSKLYENGDLAGFKPAGGTTKVSAQITSDGKTINCGTVNVEVKESVQWR